MNTVKELRQGLTRQLWNQGINPRAPHGTSVEPRVFTIEPGAENATFSIQITGPEDEPVTATMTVAITDDHWPSTMELDGQQIAYRDPWDLSRQGVERPVADWFQWLRDCDRIHTLYLRNEAVHRKQYPEDSAIAESVNMSIRGIASFHEHQVNVSEFPDAEALRAFVAEELGPQAPEVSVIPLDMAEALRKGLKVYSYLCTLPDAVKIEVPASMQGRLDADREGFGALPDLERQEESDGPAQLSWSRLHWAMEGSKIEGLLANGALEADQARSCRAEGDVADYYAVVCATMRPVLLVPAREAVIRVAWDRDGAEMTVEVEPAEWIRNLNQFKHAHEELWSKWYDLSSSLTARDVKNGIDRLTYLMTEMEKTNDNDDH